MLFASQPIQDFVYSVQSQGVRWIPNPSAMYSIERTEGKVVSHSPGGKLYVHSDERLALFGQLGQLLSDLVWLDQGSQALKDLQGLC